MAPLSPALPCQEVLVNFLLDGLRQERVIKCDLEQGKFMRKTSARFMLLAATAAMAVTPVAVSAKPSSKPGDQVTRTQSGANVDQRDFHSRRSIDDRYETNPLGNILQFLVFLSAPNF